MKVMQILYAKKSSVIYLMIVLFVAVLSQITDDKQKLELSGVFFVVAFLAAVRIKHFTTPLVTFALMLYCMAVTNEIYTQALNYTEVSRVLWFSGNAIMGFGLIDMGIKIKHDARLSQ